MKIENEFLQVTFKTQASEWTSLIDKKNNVEYAWQGEEEYWAGRNPTLFPVVGKVWQETYRLAGKKYQLGNHGFARHSNWRLADAQTAQLTMSLEDNQETRKVYPFGFELTNHYQVEGRKLLITMTVENRDERDLPFSLGAHPAFNCPLLPGEKFEDYRIVLEKREKLTRLMMNPADSSFQEKRIAWDERQEIPLTRELFAQDAVILENLDSAWVELRGPKLGVRVKVNGCPWFGIWSKDGAAFVCLEPWQGHGDFAGYQGEFGDREGTIILPPGMKYDFGYEIELLG